MDAKQCRTCRWIHIKTDNNQTKCPACGSSMYRSVETSFNEYRHQPDWFFRQQSEVEAQKILDDWMLEVLL